MKKLILLPFIAMFCLVHIRAGAQAQTPGQPEAQLNLPGDNLNLYAVMKLFQESPTLEDFEKKLNDQSLKVNNLDLDGDNQIDYIKVVDNVDGDTHNIALKVAVSQTEDQDVAVFVVQKGNDGQVHIQLIGDEDLYGKNYIVEPDTAPPSATPNPGYSGSDPAYGQAVVVDDPAAYQISAWPMVQFIYVPTYRPWRSPWHWGYYPTYWHPWTPFFWHEYYGYQYHWNYYYRAHYRYNTVYRIPAWQDHYYSGGFRSRSNIVQVRFNAGNYRQTYSRPDYASRGSDLFRRDHPNAPSVNRRLPSFDANNNNRPIIVRRNNNNGNNNGNNRGNNNGFNNNNRVSTGQNNGFNRYPNTRPNNNGNNNFSRPERPVNTIPANGNNNSSRPVTTTPVNGNNNTNRPARPVNTTPQNGNYNNANRPARPVNTTPQNGNNNNANRPARPVNTTPQNGNNNANRPARPQNNQQQPVDRPARTGNEQPERRHGN